MIMALKDAAKNGIDQYYKARSEVGQRFMPLLISAIDKARAEGIGRVWKTRTYA